MFSFKKLSDRNYPSFVSSSCCGRQAGMYKVRPGKYLSRYFHLIYIYSFHHINTAVYNFNVTITQKNTLVIVYNRSS